MQAEQQYIDIFEQERELLCSHSAALLNAPRIAAYELLKSKGLPTRKEERYKYIDLQSLFAPNYGLNLKRLPIASDPYKTFKCFVPSLKAALFFVVNDIFYPPSNASSTPESGVIVDSFSHFELAHPSLLYNYYNRLVPPSDALSAVNTMLAQDGLVVYVKQGARIEQPIQIVNMLHSAVDMMVNRRVLIILEPKSDAKILFCDHTESDVNILTTQVAEVFVGDGATLDLTSIEETHTKNCLISNTFIEQQARSSLTYNNITLHNGTTRNTLDLVLRGEGASCQCNGCAILDKQQRADTNTHITHAVGKCDSSELYKYVLNDSSQGAFAGKVLVCKDAQQTSSQMRNQNLCATKDARMQTQPMLEIYADDVKCSHGATVGQLNDSALFYMQQRGIPREEAKRLLQTAFVREVIDNIKLTPLRERLQYLVEKRFRGELSKCEGCVKRERSV